MGNSFSMTYACKYCWYIPQSVHLVFYFPLHPSICSSTSRTAFDSQTCTGENPILCAAQTRGLGCELNCCAGPRRSQLPPPRSQRDFALNLCSIHQPGEQFECLKRLSLISARPFSPPPPLFFYYYIYIYSGGFKNKTPSPIHSPKHNDHISFLHAHKLLLNFYINYSHILCLSKLTRLVCES